MGLHRRPNDLRLIRPGSRAIASRSTTPFPTAETFKLETYPTLFITWNSISTSDHGSYLNGVSIPFIMPNGTPERLASNPVTRLDQVFRIRAPHDAQTDKSDVQRPLPLLSAARDLGGAVAYAAVL
jgi:hypothetical protein